MSTDTGDNRPYDTGRDDVVFMTSDGVNYYLTTPGGPDLTSMDDRERAVLRALLTLSLARLDKAEMDMALGVTTMREASGDR